MSAPGDAGGWVRACRLAEIGEDSPVHVDVGECPVCLVRTGGALYALRDECTHESVPLSEGEVADGTIECWLHGSRFDLATGRVLSPPATRRLPCSASEPTARTSSCGWRRARERRWGNADGGGGSLASAASSRLADSGA